ncbi:MAG: 3-oxoacyl-ACP reductase [Alphaproteobacteria bacterium 64-11]|nr:SDR family oxidoreductase [Alphaproteobacteria bacterium]OJU11142.1 MAG: 3-oxoacyl-ACP reductase [Alphaproteobacteria bacterium 64-11]
MSIYQGRFAGRTAVITGGASGLGLETGRRITAEGGKVVLWDLNPDPLAAAKQQTGAVHAIALDVSDPGAVEAVAAESRKLLGRIDILVNSAGITGATHPVIGYPIDSWIKVFDVNVHGLFYCCRAIAPMMVEAGYGRIVNISSVAGKEGNPNASSYSASKAAVLGFTKSLGKELATQGVIVNAVTPATFDSPILQQVPQSHIDYMKSRIPMGRLGKSEEIAAAVCWLASEECSFTTAATLDTSGGRTTY